MSGSDPYGDGRALDRKSGAGRNAIVVATRSTHKLAEIRRILGSVADVVVLGLDDAGMVASPEEDGLEPHDTFEANARSKAEYFHARTGRPTVADDSGLVVDALEGAPGVRSRRFAPEDLVRGRTRDEANNEHLVRLLVGVPPEGRAARYVCVAVLVGGLGGSIEARGEARGVIVDEPRGSGGFGYDPHFLDPEFGRTFAELTPEEKDARSHRGRAFRELAGRLEEAW